MVTNQSFEPTDVANSTDEVRPKEEVVILRSIAMRIPNSYNIYFPSKLEEKKALSYEEFLARYADQSRRIRICFDDTSSIETMRQRSKLVTAYSFGLDCWYVVVS